LIERARDVASREGVIYWPYIAAALLVIFVF